MGRARVRPSIAEMEENLGGRALEKGCNISMVGNKL